MSYDKRQFQGDIFVFGKKLPKPLLSDDLELYFPGLDVGKPVSKETYRFRANETIIYAISPNMILEISPARSPDEIGSIRLTKSMAARAAERQARQA